MIYVITGNKEYIWNLGNKLDIPISNVTEIQADGDELEWIRDSFTGIPDYINARVLNWYDDDAKFIANCLRYGCPA